MKEPLQQAKYLKDKCPKCGDKLYTYWHTPAGDHPELGMWYVECNNGKDNCDYKYDDAFIDLEDLSKIFNIC